MIYTVAIIDDHSIVREGLKTYFNVQNKFNTFLFSSGGELLESMKTQKFDILILDVKLPDLTAFSLIPKIFKIRPSQKMLIFSMYPEESFAKLFLSLGAKGYVSKEEDNQILVDAANLILKGKIYMSEAIKKIYAEKYINGDNPDTIETLSKRELEVLMLLLSGDGLIEVGLKLDLSPSTIGTYKERIFKKMEVNNMIALYNKSLKLGLV